MVDCNRPDFSRPQSALLKLSLEVGARGQHGTAPTSRVTAIISLQVRSNMRHEFIDKPLHTAGYSFFRGSTVKSRDFNQAC